MTNTQLAQLVAYLKERAATNRQTPVTADTSSNLSSQLGNSLIKKGVNQGIKYGWQQYGAPLWEEYVSPLYSSSTASGAGGAAEGVAPQATTGATNIGGGALASEGLAGVGWGGALSLLAPLFMTWQKYQAGSGVNEPLRKKAETAGMGGMLSDMLTGKTIDPNETYKYGVKPKYLPQGLDPNAYLYGDYNSSDATVDPRGYTPNELYEGMHSYGTGHSQSGGVGNSGYSDQQIDDMFGDNKGALSKLLGYSNGLPDWSQKKWDDPGAVLGLEPRVKQQQALTDQYSSMTDNDKSDLMGRNQYNWEAAGGTGPDDRWYKQMLQKEKDKAELEKLFGFKY